MRYTLRLLTAQQFQRAAALVCAAEVLRRADDKHMGRRAVPHRPLGGRLVSPNWYDEAAKQITEAATRRGRHALGVLQTLVCPWCGTKLAAHRDLRPDDDRRRILLYCPSGEGPDPCPFSEMRSAGRGTADPDRRRGDLPAAAQPRRRDRRQARPAALARVRGHAVRPGQRPLPAARIPARDMDERTGCRSRHHKSKTGLPPVTSQPVTRLRPPDLIIQDELHLISGALGTTVGLFEAAVDELCGWPYREATTDAPARRSSRPPRRRSGHASRRAACSAGTSRSSRRRCWTSRTRSSPARCRSPPRHQAGGISASARTGYG